jgi:hypothetical protein
MTELALHRTVAAVASNPVVRFAGKRLEDLLDTIAIGIANELRRDVEVAVVARDRHGVRTWGHARRPPIGVVRVPAPSHERVIGSALDDAKPTHTRQLIGVPVEVDERVIGAVLTCATGARSLDATDWSQSNRAAGRWALTIDNAIAFATASERAANLEIALAGRAVIEQAKGILMERERCDASRAFAILRDLSQRGDLKLAAVAAQVVAAAHG